MLMLSVACAAPHTDRAALDTIAEGYVRTALQLAQHQPTLVENWRGNGAWRPGAREPIAALRRRLAALSSTLPREDAGDAEPRSMDRAGYLRRQLAALDLAARRLLGESMPFAEEVATAFARPLLPIDTVRVNAARDTLARLLPQPASGTATLGQRHAAFRRTVTVPPERATDVLSAAIAACRERTRAHVALPSGEHVDLRLGVDSPWDGFARYQGHARSTIEISGRSPLDISRALHLACHEAYPGHHTQDVLLDAEAASGGRAELLLQPAFGPHLLIAEGAAEVGADLAFPPAERVRFYHDVLLPRAGLPASRADALVEIETAVFTLETIIPEIIATYLDSRASRDTTIAALANDAAVMEPESLLAFAERQRTRAVVYVLGRQVVEEWLAAHRGREWQTLAALFSTRPMILE